MHRLALVSLAACTSPLGSTSSALTDETRHDRLARVDRDGRAPSISPIVMLIGHDALAVALARSRPSVRPWHGNPCACARCRQVTVRGGGRRS
jgi:hypothetical protein